MQTIQINKIIEGNYVANVNVEIFSDLKLQKGEKFQVKKCKDDIFHRYLIIKSDDVSHIEMIFLLVDIRLGYIQPDVERPTDFPDELH